MASLSASVGAAADDVRAAPHAETSGSAATLARAASISLRVRSPWVGSFDIIEGSVSGVRSDSTLAQRAAKVYDWVPTYAASSGAATASSVAIESDIVPASTAKAGFGRNCD